MRYGLFPIDLSVNYSDEPIKTSPPGSVNEGINLNLG
jgi:hypothetical protein